MSEKQKTPEKETPKNIPERQSDTALKESQIGERKSDSVVNYSEKE